MEKGKWHSIMFLHIKLAAVYTHMLIAILISVFLIPGIHSWSCLEACLTIQWGGEPV